MTPEQRIGQLEAKIDLALDALNFDAGNWTDDSRIRHLEEQIERAKRHLNNQPQQMQPPETAPKTGEPILAQIGTPHMVVAMWNAHDSEWVVAAPHINMIDGKYTDPYFENEYVNEITGWMPIPKGSD